MTNGTDIRPPAEPDPNTDDARTSDDAWGHVPDDEEGSTWELYQDDGAFPSWL